MKVTVKMDDGLKNLWKDIVEMYEGDERVKCGKGGYTNCYGDKIVSIENGCLTLQGRRAQLTSGDASRSVINYVRENNIPYKASSSMPEYPFWLLVSDAGQVTKDFLDWIQTAELTQKRKIELIDVAKVDGPMRKRLMA